jgi:muconate cycloisomerase
MIGSMPELGIGTAAQIHLGIAMPNLDFDSDTCGSLYQEEDLLATSLRFENGFAYAPEGPGLGVELDPEAFGRAARRSPPA